MLDLVSIIIPVYNAEKYLQELLDSVEKQTYKNIEVIIIDDGSIDSSSIIANKKVEQDGRFRYYYILNNGVSYARNFGINKAKGKYITFIDADDIVSADFIECLYSDIKETNSECASVGIKGFINQKKDNIQNSKKIIYEGEKILLGYFEKYGGFLANKMFRKDIIEKQGLMLNKDIHICEDLLFNLQYSKYCNKMVYNDSCKYFYRIHKNSSFYNLNNRKWFSILDTYKILLENYTTKDYKVLENIIIYNCFMIAYEAKYRARICKEDNDVYEKINLLEKECFERQGRFTLQQRLKILLFKKSPNFVMCVKRRRMKG